MLPQLRKAQGWPHTHPHASVCFIHTCPKLLAPVSLTLDSSFG